MSAVINPSSTRFKNQTARINRRAALVAVPARNKAHNPKLFMLSTVIVGFLTIAMANLLMTVATSSGVYQVANLKATKQKLALDTQILSQQVTSLSSNQNLSNAAAVLGMVSNSTPVFLNLNEQKVYGTPSAAVATNLTSLGRNLVPNAAMITKTQASALKAAVAKENAQATAPIAAIPAPSKPKSVDPKTASGLTPTSVEASRVTAAKSDAGKVVLTGGIPAAPSH